MVTVKGASAMSAKCHVCGFDNDSDSKSCSECGIELNSALQFASDKDFDETEDRVIPLGTDTPLGEDPDLSIDNIDSPVSESDNDSQNSSDQASPVLVGSEVVALPEQGVTVIPQSKEDGNLSGSEKALVPEVVSPTVCPSCMADVDEADFYCSICGVNIQTFVSAEDLRMSSPCVTEPGGKLCFKLVVVTGHDKGAIHSFSRTEALLGRALDNDIILASDGYTSGRHSRVFKEDDTFYVEDLGSTNGTFIRVKQKIAIKAGDEIKVGQSIFRFEDVEEQV